jgi:hypothetical protein
MKSLMERYTEETHRGAYRLMCHVHAATDEYVEWLEARLEAAESANTASNKPRAEICAEAVESNYVCHYCCYWSVERGRCGVPGCMDHDEFKGRKLSPVG